MPIIAASCSAACLAALFHISENRVRALARLQVIKRLRHGEYDLLASLEGYIAYLRMQSQSQKPSLKPPALLSDGPAVALGNVIKSRRPTKSREVVC